MLLLMKVSLLMSWRISGKFPDSRLCGQVRTLERGIGRLCACAGRQIPAISVEAR